MTAQPLVTISAVAVPRVDPGAVGIHLAWSGPELSPLARGGYKIRRRPHREPKRTSLCAAFDAARLTRLSGLGLLPDELGVMLLHTWRPVASAGPLPLSDNIFRAAGDTLWSVFTQQLTSPAEHIVVTCTARSAVAIAVRGDKAVAVAAVPATAAAILDGQDIDTVVVYARAPSALRICAERQALPADEAASWKAATIIATGLTLPLRETDPALTTTAQELATARSRLMGSESMSDQEGAYLFTALRTGAAITAGRPCDRVLLDRTERDTPFQETVFGTRIGVLTLDPKLRRILGFGFVDTTAVAGQTYDYRVSGLFDPADIADAIYDVHQIPSGTKLPSTFRIGDVTMRFGVPTEVVLDPLPSPSALAATSRRGLAIAPGSPVDGFVSWWTPKLSCVIDLPYAVERVIFEVPSTHTLSCSGVLSDGPDVTPTAIPPGPHAEVTFPAPADQLRIFGSGTLYALRLRQPTTSTGELSCACGPVTLAAQPLPAAPAALVAVNLQAEPAVLTGAIGEQTPVADRPQPGFRIHWTPSTLGGSGTWPDDLPADPPTDTLAYLIEHRRVYPGGSADAWEAIQAGDNLTFGAWPTGSGAPSLSYGIDLNDAYPLHRVRPAGAAVAMSVTDILSGTATTDDPPRAAAPLGSLHQYRILAMDVVGRLSAAWTESALVRLEKHLTPPMPVGPQPEPALVGTPPRMSGPAGVTARTVLAADPDLSAADGQLLAGHQSAVILSWGWAAAQRELDTITTEFRVYVQKSNPTTVPGTITAVTSAINQWLLNFSTDRDLLSDECAGQWLTSAGQAFRIITHTGGSTPQLTVAASLVNPSAAPQTGPTRFGRPLSAGHQRPAGWPERVAVVALTDADTYSHTVFDLLSVSAVSPRDEAWIGVSAADAESYVEDELPAAALNGGRPGNESSIAAVTATARYNGRPDFSVAPPLGDVPETVTDEPTGRSVSVALDAATLIGGALAPDAQVALDRCPLDAVLAVIALNGSDVTLRRVDGTHQVVTFANPADEAEVRASLASAHPERIASRYALFLLGHFDRPDELFTRTDTTLQSATALADTLAPKPGRYFYRVRLADAASALSVGGAILPTVVRVPSTMPMPAPVRRSATVDNGALAVDITLQADPELAWALLFCRVGDWGTAAPGPAEAQLLRMPNRRDLYPDAGVRLRLPDGAVLAPATTAVAGIAADADGLLELPMSTALPPGAPGRLRWVQYWCCGLSRDGVPSPTTGPYTLPVAAT